MGLFSRLFSRSRQKSEVKKTFEELEAEASSKIEEDYAEKKRDTLSDVISELEDEELQKLDDEVSEVPVEFHVEDASADDLLQETPMVNHYSMAKGDEIDPNTADQHLVEAKSVDDEMSGYEQIEVPVMDDDIEWNS
tara:strand:+ start:427 stop:837 length:411 start_codon:yes stop_codon:yes gene_type:complete